MKTESTQLIFFYIKNELPSFFMLFFLSFAICSILLIVSYWISIIYMNSYTEKLINFECGFDPFSNTKKPFNIKFFLITILFLIFDVEILFLLPWFLYYQNYSTISFFFILIFIYVLFLGLYYLFKSIYLCL
jgi:NADH:ubiquinone oxidoreductase subunit 3 (subunit A)